tara:strand:+ start:211 stop:627 length:417 start_codon:yes stop_codon:yes gene_type:complete
MNKLFLTMTMAFFATFASAQYVALTTITEVEENYNITDKIGIGYEVNDKLMVGITMNGEDKYNLLGRYDLHNGIWATCIYNHESDNEEELMDNMDVGIGYSLKVWKELYIDPSYTMPVKENEAGEREGTLNLGISYRF